MFLAAAHNLGNRQTGIWTTSTLFVDSVVSIICSLYLPLSHVGLQRANHEPTFTVLLDSFMLSESEDSFRDMHELLARKYK